MEAALSELQAAVADIVRLVPGGELDLNELQRPPEELARFGLGGNPGYLLVETPYVGWPLDLGEKLFRLRALGITPVLGHPERNPDIKAHPELLEPIVAGGALVQLTAASVDGRLGRSAQRCARTLLDRRLAHLIASDAHAPSVRGIGLADAARAVGDPALARWLTVDVPQAIVDGDVVPAFPESTKRRRRFRLGGG